MNSNNLIFSSSIPTHIEDIAFDMLNDYLRDTELERVYVKNVSLAPNEVIFFAEIEGKESIIRIRV
jgi:hypothetical protein